MSVITMHNFETLVLCCMTHICTCGCDVFGNLVMVQYKILQVSLFLICLDPVTAQVRELQTFQLTVFRHFVLKGNTVKHHLPSCLLPLSHEAFGPNAAVDYLCISQEGH